MAFLTLSGPSLNHLTRALTAPAMSPAADANFPVANLYDNRSSIPAYFSAIGADSTVTVDTCAISDASFEAGITSWTAAAGTMTQSNTTANTGTYSAKFAAAGSYYYAFTARSGELRMISAALYGGGGSCASRVRLYCVETGHYLQSGGASWAAASSDLFTRTTASWATSTQAYTVEPVATTLADTVTLRVYVEQVNAGTTYRDDVVDIPGVTWGSVHGHNLSAAVAPLFQSSPDNSSWTTRISPTIQRDSFYGTCAVQYLRYWRLLLSGTPGAIPWLGEVVIGQHAALNVNPLYGGTLELQDVQVRLETGDGGQWALSRGGAPLRRLSLSFAYRNDTDYQQAKDVLFRGSRGGRNIAVVAPVEMDSSVVILGRIGETSTFVKSDYWSRSGEWELREDPLPNVVYTP
jgi:hypothetical protein